jgi:CYTH domain-containing protein
MPSSREARRERGETRAMSDTGNGDFEFERRFWVERPPTELLESAPALIVQSYLLAQDGFAVRVRAQASAVAEALDPADDELALLERHVRAVDFCAITVKGPMVEGTRYEAERELDPTVAVELIRRADARVAKLRHSVWLGADGWVIDVFAGGNAPLVVAEVERGGPVTDLLIPDFCVTEVTTDARFANDGLARSPYGAWAASFATELVTTGPRFLTGLGHNHRAGEAPPA